MSKININDHLDDMMDRIMNEDLQADELELEIKRSTALCQIAKSKIDYDRLKLQALKMVTAGDINRDLISNDYIKKLG